VASSSDFHEKPFDEGTLTKLHILELYARACLPVFLARESPTFTEIHIYDFFAGPGADPIGQPGSPLRLLSQLDQVRHLPGWANVKVHAHFSDADADKIALLRTRISDLGSSTAGIEFDIEPLRFEEAFERSRHIRQNRKVAKLLLIDQCGVSYVTSEVFEQLVGAPTCDFLFFLSSSTLNRFHDHPAITQKITRPDDPHLVHRAATDYYRSLLPAGARYHLAPFSIKKGANIYGLIFGSGHPLGMAKFLDVAWAEDQVNGEADFNINRDNILPGQPRLFEATKLGMFKDELTHLLRSGAVLNERSVIEVCFKHGVRPQHAEPVLTQLKREGTIDLSFRVPQVKNFAQPRLIHIKDRSR